MIAIQEAIRTVFVDSGYEWLEDGTPQRTLAFEWLLAPEDAMPELERLNRLAPGFLDPESLQNGVIAIGVSWPGRAEPVFRASIEGVAELDLPLQARLNRIPEAVSKLLDGLPMGPVSAKKSEDDTSGISR